MDALIFEGDNYRECKEFCNGHYNNILSYPNIVDKEGKVIEVLKGDFIMKDSEGNLAVMQIKGV